MSNYHAIATVTATLGDLLFSDLKDTFSGITITAKPLDALELEGPAVRLNLLLYHIAPNIGYQNFAAPTRGSLGELVRNPIFGINLNYLLTAYTDEITDSLQEIHSQQILAKAMMTLNEKPILTRDMILQTRTSNPRLSTPTLDDHLETQVELVKFTQNPLSLEEMNKIWSSFFQTHYRLSVSYLATVVLLENKVQPRVSLPVQERKLYVLPFSRPVIDHIEPQIIEFTNEAKISLVGRNLSGAKIKVLFDNSISVQPEHADNQNNKLIVKIPQNLSAGIKQLQVINLIVVEEENSKPQTAPVEKDNWNVSNVAAFVLAPRIIDPSLVTTKRRGELLTIKIEPGVQEHQKVVVFIAEREFKINLPPPVPPELYPRKALPPIQIPFDLPITDPTAPDPSLHDPYIIRVRVDGADSFIRLDNIQNSPTFGKYLPSVKVIE
jgi:hypothetical protein